MPSFPGSLFFSDTEYLKHRTFLSSHYNLPLFIYSKFGRPKNFNQRNKSFLRKQLHRYKKIYSRSAQVCTAKYLECVANEINFKKSRHERQKTNNRNAFVTPAANHYKIKGTDLADICEKQSGTKGPYSCFTGVRDKSTYHGHMIEVVGYTPISKNFYYDLPSEMNRLSQPRNHFVMKMRKGSRDKQRTYMRSMLNDLSLCPKNPKFPGPDKYYPQNFLIQERAFNPTKTCKSHIFHPGQYIPESNRFYSNISILPGPGRYNPHIIACPCKRGTEYLENSTRAAEHQNWKYSPFYSQTHHLKQQSTCEAPSIRNIAGKGFTSVFKSATKRLIDVPKIDQKSLSKKDPGNADKFPMILDTQYVRLISQPRRKTLSYRIDHKPGEVADIKFNTTAKVKPRQKLRTNKTVAFMSSCPRFEGDGGKATFLANKNTSSKKSTSNTSLKNVETTRFTTKECNERLTKIPLRYQRIELDSGNDKLGNLFQHLPKPKILLKQVFFNQIGFNLRQNPCVSPNI